MSDRIVLSVHREAFEEIGNRLKQIGEAARIRQPSIGGEESIDMEGLELRIAPRGARKFDREGRG